LGRRLPSRPARESARPSSARRVRLTSPARPRHIVATAGAARPMAGIRRSPATPGRPWPPRARTSPFQAAGAPPPPPAKLAAGGPPPPSIACTSLCLHLQHVVLVLISPFELGRFDLSRVAAVGHGAAALDLTVGKASPLFLVP
jgi:hypothetical protein